MKRMFLTPITALALFFGAFVPPATAQNARDLARISAYLNGIGTLAGDFVQIDPDGILSEGQFYMRRPGRIRFEYREPNPALVIADGIWVGIVDKRYSSVTRLPLSSTPLNLILKTNVDLSEEGAITHIDRSDGQLRVVAQDPDEPEAGTITMVFGDSPLELRQWIVDDPQGGVTTVALSALRADVEVPGALFIIPDDGTDESTGDR
ncbi:MAG: LolA family protein [Pikeienuella sp.]